MTATVIVLPAGEPPVPRPPGFPSLASWPRSADRALRWPSHPLADALRHAWDADAHFCQHRDRRSPTDWYRFSVDVLATPDADEIELVCAVADLDRPGHAPWPSRAAAALAVGVLRDAYPDAAIYSTRAGVRLVWELANPVPLAHARWWLRAWHTARAAELPPTLGLRYDLSCAEWTRHFRLPHVLRDGQRLTPVCDLDTTPIAWMPPGEPHAERPGARDPSGAVVPVGSRPDHLTPIIDTSWSAWVSRTSVVGSVLPLLLERRAWGPPEVPEGERNNRLKQAVNSLAFQLRRGTALTPSPIELYAVFAPSVAADRDGVHLDDLWRFANAASAAEAERRRELAPPPPSSDADDLPPELVTHGDGVGYVLDPTAGAYRGPCKGSDLYVALRELAATTIPLTRPSGRALRPVSELLVDHAIRAERVELHYPGAALRTPWSPDTRTARVRVLRPIEVPPEEDPACAEWLAVLFSDAPAEVQRAVFDWLATVGQLDRPTAALYLQGPNSAGKGMLAAAIAQLWGAAPISLREAIGTWSEGLLTSPVAFLDEGMAADRAATQRFRSLVAETNHRIEGKNKPLVTLHGCPRVVVAANNPRALDMVGEHGAEDLAAIVERILHVQVSASAVEWLRDYGGRDATDPHWIRSGQGPGRLVRHLAYLAASRQVVPGPRFLVGGVVTEYHVRLVTGDPLYAQVLACLAAALAPRAGQAGGPGVFCSPDAPGVVWVNPMQLHTRWKVLVTEDIPRPTVQRVAGACQALSRDHVPRSYTRGAPATTAAYWPVAGDLVLRTAHDLGFPDVHKIRLALVQGTEGASPARVADVAQIGRSS